MADKAPRFKLVPQLEGFFRRYKLLHEGKLVFCLNSAPAEEASWLRMRRPSFHPFVTPAGVQVTEQGGHTMPHHKAVWIAHGEVNGVNYYTDEGETGLIITREVSFRETAEGARLDSRIEWVEPGGGVALEETRNCHVFVTKQAHRLDIETILKTPLPEARISKEKHAFFHLRPLDILSEDQGGTVSASNAKSGAEAVHETMGYWIDLRGKAGSQEAGAVIMVHKDFGPQPLFSRSYGTIAINPFFFEGKVLKKGESLRNVYSFWAYDNPKSFDPEESWEDFNKTCPFIKAG